MGTPEDELAPRLFLDRYAVDIKDESRGGLRAGWLVLTWVDGRIRDAHPLLPFLSTLQRQSFVDRVHARTGQRWTVQGAERIGAFTMVKETSEGDLYDLAVQELVAIGWLDRPEDKESTPLQGAIEDIVYDTLDAH